MVNCYIDNKLVELTAETVAERNRKEVSDYGKITIVNTREDRYEPNTVVEIGQTGDYEQYIIESDEPLLLRDDLYEHQINLGECMLKLDTVFPVDRSFTTVPAKTIREILDTYIRELEFYQGFNLAYVDDALFDTQVPNKEYSGSMAEIVYDLFRSINAIPRLSYDFDTDTWTITHELYTKRNNAITLAVEGQQSSVNDIDYATEVLAKSRNTVDENNFIWYPSKDGWVTPRTEGTMFQTSALRYELDSDIMALDRVVAKSPIDAGNYFIDVEGAPGSERFYLDIPTGEILQVDFKRNVLETEAFDALKTIGEDISITDRQYLVGFNQELVKEGCISYDAQGRYIENLFSQIDGFLGFTNNIYHLRSAINSNIFYSLKKNAWDRLVDNYLKNSSDTTPASAEDKALIKAMTTQEIYDRLSENISNFAISSDTENIEVRLRYRPKRDIDFVTERYKQGNFNKTTILSNQKDSFIDIGRYIENNYTLANRVGNVINNVTESFDTWAERWQVGDYVGEWLIIDVRWQIDTNNIVCIADFAKGFANTNKEYALSREPSAYVYTGKRLQSNFIFKQYLELYKTDTAVGDDTLLSDNGKRVILNIFDFDNEYNKPLTNANIVNNNTGEFIDAPLVTVGRGNTMLWHFVFDDPRVAGNGMIFTGEAGRGTYAWYKDPVFYTNEDFEVDTLRFKLATKVAYKTDTSSRKYYPTVDKANDYYWYEDTYPIDKDPNASLAFTHELIVYSEDDDIIIGNAFTKYNNLLREFEDTPTLVLYEGLSAYTILDKYVRDTDTIVTGGQITLNGQSLTVLDSLDQSIEYWCIAYGDEIVLAGNNNVSQINFRFLKTRSNEYLVGVFSGEGNIEFNLASLNTVYTKSMTGNNELLFELNDLITERIIPYKFTGENDLNFTLSNLVFDYKTFINFTGNQKVEFILDNLNWEVTTFINFAIEGNVGFELNDLITEHISPITFMGNKDLQFNMNNLIYEHIIYKTITYNLNGGINVGNPTQITNTDNYPIPLNDAIRSGYTFDGWYETSDFSTPRLYALNTFKAYTLYAKWI
jgi:uncharacterized repeat protein (TIGR02543 family)